MTDFRRPDLDLWDEEADDEDARPTLVGPRPTRPAGSAEPLEEPDHDDRAPVSLVGSGPVGLPRPQAAEARVALSRQAARAEARGMNAAETTLVDLEPPFQSYDEDDTRPLPPDLPALLASAGRAAAAGPSANATDGAPHADTQASMIIAALETDAPFGAGDDGRVTPVAAVSAAGAAGERPSLAEFEALRASEVDRLTVRPEDEWGAFVQGLVSHVQEDPPLALRAPKPLLPHQPVPRQHTLRGLGVPSDLLPASEPSPAQRPLAAAGLPAPAWPSQLDAPAVPPSPGGAVASWPLPAAVVSEEPSIQRFPEPPLSEPPLSEPPLSEAGADGEPASAEAERWPTAAELAARTMDAPPVEEPPAPAPDASPEPPSASEPAVPSEHDGHAPAPSEPGQVHAPTFPVPALADTGLRLVAVANAPSDHAVAAPDARPVSSIAPASHTPPSPLDQPEDDGATRITWWQFAAAVAVMVAVSTFVRSYGREADGPTAAASQPPADGPGRAAEPPSPGASASTDVPSPVLAEPAPVVPAQSVEPERAPPGAAAVAAPAPVAEPPPVAVPAPAAVAPATPHAVLPPATAAALLPQVAAAVVRPPAPVAAASVASKPSRAPRVDARRPSIQPAAPRPPAGEPTASEPPAPRAEAPAASASDVAPSSSRADLPSQPDRTSIVATMEALMPDLRSCVGETHGEAELKLTVRSTGTVSYALVGGDYAGTPEGSCLAQALRKASFPAFSDPVLRLTYPARF